MNTKELLVEIAKVRSEIALLPPGSIMIGDLTCALVALYDMYVKAHESPEATKEAA